MNKQSAKIKLNRKCEQLNGFLASQLNLLAKQRTEKLAQIEQNNILTANVDNIDDLIKQLVNGLGDFHEKEYMIWRKRDQPQDNQQIVEPILNSEENLAKQIEDFYLETEQLQRYADKQIKTLQASIKLQEEQNYVHQDMKNILNRKRTYDQYIQGQQVQIDDQIQRKIDFYQQGIEKIKLCKATFITDAEALLQPRFELLPSLCFPKALNIASCRITDSHIHSDADVEFEINVFPSQDQRQEILNGELQHLQRLQIQEIQWNSYNDWFNFKLSNGMKTNMTIERLNDKVITYSIAPYQVIKRITWYESKYDNILNSLAMFDKNANVIIKIGGYDIHSGDTDHTEHTLVVNDDERVFGVQWKKRAKENYMYDIQWILAQFK